MTIRPERVHLAPIHAPVLLALRTLEMHSGHPTSSDFSVVAILVLEDLVLERVAGGTLDQLLLGHGLTPPPILETARDTIFLERGIVTLELLLSDGSLVHICDSDKLDLGGAKLRFLKRLV